MPGGFDISSKFAIGGLGVSRQGRKLGVSARELRLEALELALADAGLARRDIDGHIGASSTGLFDDIRHMGLSPRFSYSRVKVRTDTRLIWSRTRSVGRPV